MVFKMSDLIQVNGLYFFPPVCYEKSSVPWLKLMSPFPFNGNKIFIDQDGYLATSMDNKDVSENIINSVFLSTSLLKYQVLRANKGELETLKIDLNSNMMTSHSAAITSLRGCMHIHPEIRKEYPEVIIKKEEFEIILQHAEKIFNSKFKTAVLTFYDSYTLYDIGDYTGSFLMGWMSIENYLSTKIEEYFKNMSVFQDLINKLNREWNVDKKLKYLKKNNILSKDKYDEYDNLRQIRNNIIHSNYIPTETDSEKCKLAANLVMWELFKMEGIDHNYYLDKMKKLSS
jgi:hypothetical protein